MLLIGGLLAAAGGPAVAVTARASAAAHTTIAEQATVRMSWTMAMPSVQGGSSGASFIGANPSMGMGMLMMMPATTTIRREDQTGQPVTAPAGFDVVGGQGNQSLIVRTGSTPEFRVAGDGSIVGGLLPGGAAASIGVGRELAAGQGGPLVVVVQYN